MIIRLIICISHLVKKDNKDQDLSFGVKGARFER